MLLIPQTDSWAIEEVENDPGKPFQIWLAMQYWQTALYQPRLGWESTVGRGQGRARIGETWKSEFAAKGMILLQGCEDKGEGLLPVGMAGMAHTF